MFLTTNEICFQTELLDLALVSGFPLFQTSFLHILFIRFSNYEDVAKFLHVVLTRLNFLDASSIFTVDLFGRSVVSVLTNKIFFQKGSQRRDSIEILKDVVTFFFEHNQEIGIRWAPYGEVFEIDEILYDSNFFLLNILDKQLVIPSDGEPIVFIDLRRQSFVREENQTERVVIL